MDLFHRRLEIYDNHLVYEHRTILKKFETTIAYSHISKFFLTRGVFFAEVEIVAPGLKEGIKLRYVNKKGAMISKFLIDEKIKYFNGKSSKEDFVLMDKIEKFIKRLQQLRKEKKIGNKELEKRKLGFLKNMIKFSKTH